MENESVNESFDERGTAPSKSGSIIVRMYADAGSSRMNTVLYGEKYLLENVSIVTSNESVVRK